MRRLAIVAGIVMSALAFVWAFAALIQFVGLAVDPIPGTVTS